VHPIIKLVLANFTFEHLRFDGLRVVIHGHNFELRASLKVFIPRADTSFQHVRALIKSTVVTLPPLVFYWAMNLRVD
jgi:hypothetical protein